MSGGSLGRFFIDEFLDKELVDFDDCRSHYETMTPDDLMTEMGFLFSAETLAVPFAFSANRYYAFLVCLIACAGNSRDLSDYRRVQLVNLAIDIHQYVRGRTDEDQREAFDRAFSVGLDEVGTFGLFPKVSELVAEKMRDYSGTFEESVVGQILERRQP
jgi:hypothetical protein